jgi:predicted transposase YbfD/YdcC
MYCHQSVDGKEARGSGRSEDTKNPQRNINVLNVYSNSDCLCIHSKPVETKTNEIPVAQEILRMMELKKTVITFDALHTQRETCNIIASKKGIYVAPVKDNQSGLREEILEKFKKYEKTPKKKITTLDTEKRNFRFISLPSNYDDCGFTGMKTFVEMVSHTRKKSFKEFYADEVMQQKLEFKD